MYTVDYFIRKFEAIPEEKWCIETQMNALGQRCALGHCMPADVVYAFGNGFGHKTSEGTALRNLMLLLCINPGNVVADINNGDTTKYQQPTPKQRILAALHDIKKMQEPEVKPEPIAKREKVKVQISTDLIAPPIPKEVEKIDREETLESVMNDFNKSFDSYGDAIDKTIDLVMDIAYKDYKRAREGNHFLTPEFFEGIYKREDIEKFESRYQSELKG